MKPFPRWSISFNERNLNAMIRILTDSATDFTQEELQKLNVRCVPMTIAFGGDTYTDGS